MSMRLFPFKRKRAARPSDARPQFRHCEAKTGIGTFCPQPAMPGKNLCRFHANLVGPWSRADRIFEEFK